MLKFWNKNNLCYSKIAAVRRFPRQNFTLQTLNFPSEKPLSQKNQISKPKKSLTNQGLELYQAYT